ncbi:sigma-70 family RNA polymerase sigma factor [Spirillospora sp. CA-294931]|uniref:sigma-70 family RNA polymerase sigma factor n=1 Tax=Spirillospora sp. CA-294931 TaxID=3240042 RepID=UPI003D94DF19
MDENDWLAEGFEAHRPQLRAVAYRLLGSIPEADDAVQEAWLRLNRSAGDRVQNLGGWLTTVVGRICLDMLRSRTARREDPLDGPVGIAAAGYDPEQEALQADAVGLALLVVLETLTPAERLAFVLHDVFAVPFREVAAVLGRSPAAAKMLASRARRRVQAAGAAPDTDQARRNTLVRAFLAASREGDFDALIALLEPDVVLRADDNATRAGAPGELLGAKAVAGQFCGRAQAARPALVDGAAGAVWAPRGRPRVVFDFTVADGRITAIDLIADPEELRHLDLEIPTG